MKHDPMKQPTLRCGFVAGIGEQSSIWSTTMLSLLQDFLCLERDNYKLFNIIISDVFKLPPNTYSIFIPGILLKKSLFEFKLFSSWNVWEDPVLGRSWSMARDKKDSQTTYPIETRPVTTRPMTTRPMTTRPMTTRPMTARPMATCPMDTSPHGQLAPWTACPMDSSPHGQLPPWTARPMDSSSHGQLAPWTIRPMDNPPMVGC